MYGILVIYLHKELPLEYERYDQRQEMVMMTTRGENVRRFPQGNARKHMDTRVVSLAKDLSSRLGPTYIGFRVLLLVLIVGGMAMVAISARTASADPDDWVNTDANHAFVTVKDCDGADLQVRQRESDMLTLHNE